jgi:hypothetical protein
VYDALNKTHRKGSCITTLHGKDYRITLHRKDSCITTLHGKDSRATQIAYYVNQRTNRLSLKALRVYLIL